MKKLSAVITALVMIAVNLTPLARPASVQAGPARVSVTEGTRLNSKALAPTLVRPASSVLRPLPRPLQLTPDDPLFPQQWALTHVHAPDAWDVTTGSPEVVIAVLDTGIDVDHPDLAGRLWTNPGETPGNSIDDDANGFIDDAHGWNFIAQTNEVDDDDGRGTRIAGAAVAQTNNGAGIAGLCWNCRLMIVKVVQSGGVANYSDVAKGVDYAVAKGAEVILIGVGGYADSPVLRAAIEAASETAVVVAAAGDGNTSAPFYPAAYPDALAVGGTAETDARATFSNYGDWVDVAAPAVSITTTLNGGGYGAASSTGQAAALVAGLAGLIRSQHADWSTEMVKAQIVHTADAIAAPGLGSGRINAASTVTQAPHPVLEIASTAVNGDPLDRPTPGQNATLAVTLRNDWWTAANVAGVLSTTDPYVTMGNYNASYGTLLPGGTAAGSPVYSFTVAGGAGYNHPIPFTLAVIANAGGYVAAIPFTITTRSADYTFCGTITADQTWTSDKTYIINCNVGVAPGYTLTIQAGTVIRFNGNYNLNVGGALIADGTEEQPIRFMSHTGGSWGRIYFDDQSIDARTTVSGTYQGGNILRWMHVEGATQGIGCNNATPYLEHVTTDGGGINCTAGNTPVWMVDSEITGESTFPLEVPINGTWTTRASMSTARRHLGIVAASNGKIYAIGGDGGENIVEEYDPEADLWVARANMPTPRYGLGVVAATNGKIYAIGGIHPISGTIAVVEEYDPATNTWATRASMLTARSALGVVATSDGKIYAIGGWGAGIFDTVEEYDIVADIWIPRASMSTAREGLGAVATGNDIIYAIGGWNNSSFSTVEAYDPSADTWTTYANMPTARNDLGVVVAGNGKIYAMGGSSSDIGVSLPIVEEYDPNTNTWITRASMPTGRDYLGAATATNGNVYAIGGGAYGTPLAIVEEFAPIFLEYGYHIHNVIICNGNLNLPEASQVLASTIGGSINAGSGSTVQNTTASGGITINGGGTISDNTTNGTISLGSGIVQNNTVNGGGISIGSGSVLTNTVRGGGISAGSGSTVRSNDVENAPGWGIEASGNTTIVQNRVVGNTSGVNATDSTVAGNLIANSTGIGLQVSGGTVTSNTLTGNGGNAIVVASGAPVIRNNNLEFNHGTYELVNNTANPITATLNWWGTTDSGTIGARVYDYYDDFNLGRVIYTPVLTGPVQDAPAYVRQVTVTPNPVGIETATFDVLFSRAMDTANTPVLEFYTTQRDTSWTVYDTNNSGLPNNCVRAIAVDAEGNKWLGTNGGVAYFDGNTWTVYNTSNSGLPSDSVPVIAIDAEGNKWFGTDGSGVVHFDGSTWTVYNTDNSGLPNNSVSAITVDAEGNKWFGSTWSGGVARFDGNAWTVYNIGNSGLPSDFVPAIAIDMDGSKWFGSYWGGVAHFDDHTWIVYNTDNSGLGDNYVHAIAIDAKGNKWFGTDFSVTRFSGGTWTVLNDDTRSNVWNIAIDTEGNKWFSNWIQGVKRFDDYTWTVYNTSNSGLPNDSVDAIAIDEKGNRWFGTEGGIGILWHEPAYLVTEKAEWLFSTLYRATYDVNALIPSGTYTLAVQNGNGADGIRIAPNTVYTFTVDYIGTPETTYPPTPIVRACASLSTTTLSAQWSVPTAQSIGLYRYAIGTAPGRSDVTNWVTTTLISLTRNNLNLLPGQTYYFSVQARNTGGLWSEIGSSNGVVAGAGGCPGVDFGATPTSGMSPLAVAFTPHTTGTVNSYLWSYGNGVTSTQASPAYTYTIPGPDPAVYTVTLDVWGPGGWSTAVKSGYISVTPDTVPPTGWLTIDSGAIYVATTTVGLDVIASDPSDLDGMRFSNDGMSYTEWTTYTEAVSRTLTAGDGPKIVFAQVRDVPGNVATFTDTVTLDTTPPTATVSTLPEFVGTAAFTVIWTGHDEYAGLASYDVQVRAGAGGAWTDWRTSTTQTSAVYTGAHGQTYYFRARARDTLGNLGAYTPSDGDAHTAVDLLPPVGSVVVNGGAAYANSLGVTLALSATDLSGAAAFQASNDGVSYGGWISYTTAYSWMLAAGDGTKTVYVRYRDVVGHESALVSDTITLDATPPTGSIVIDGDAAYAASAAITLTLAADDATSSVALMQFSNDGANWSSGEPFAATKAWTLAGGDGLKQVYVQYSDNAGNAAVFSDTITLDTGIPTGSISIAGGAAIVGAPAVILSLSAADGTSGVGQMQFSNDGDSWSSWETYASTKAWTLTSGDGLKRVYVRYRDAAGNVSAAYDDTVVLDTTPPAGSVQISGGAIYTPIPTVTLTLTATDATSITHMQISSFPAFSGAIWETFALTRAWNLNETGTVIFPDGEKAVYVRYRDAIGNISAAYSDTIILHTESPTGTLTIADGAWATASPSVTLTITATDDLGLAEMCLANGLGPCDEWEPFAAMRAWTLPDVDGLHTVAAHVRDLAGNVAVLADDILLDTTPPSAAVEALTPYQAALTFTVAWTGTDALAGLATYDVQARTDGGIWGDWLTSTAALSATFAGLDGHTFSFRARARDVLGNLSAYTPGDGDVSTHVDTTRPQGDIAVNGGALDATSRDVQLVLLANGASRAAFSDDGVNFTAWEPFPSTFEVRPYQLSAGDGLKTVYVRFEDFYGQVVVYSDTIWLNTSIPGEVGLSINDDAPSTNQVTVTLTLKAPPGTRSMLLSNSSRFVGAEWEPYAASHTWVLAYHPDVSVYQVYVRFRSVDGVVGERYDDIITLNLLEPPPPVDSTPPSGSVVINTGAAETSIPTATLDVLAADDPGGVGVEWMYFREWKYDPVAVQWVIVRSSGWLSYTENPTAWTLAAGTGVKYVGVWFADAANNVSHPIALDSINLVLPGDTISETEVTQYRQSFEACQTVTITLYVSSGDADLYVWRPGSTGAPDYWSNLPGTATEQLVFTAVEGEYLIEVHGYASSVYTLDISTGSGGGQRQMRTSRFSVMFPATTGRPPLLSRSERSAPSASKPLPACPLVVTRPGGVESPYGSPVVANFTATPLAGQPPLTVTFTDTSSGTVTSWLWQFGDTLTSTAQHPTHTYTLTGTYSVTLTVNGPGGSDTYVERDYIRVRYGLVANFGASPRSGYRPLNVQFTDESAGDIVSWQWDFGDTFTSTAQHPAHVYTQVGTYTISLQVSGPGGSDVLTREAYIIVREAPGHDVYLPLVIRSGTGQVTGRVRPALLRRLRR